MGHKILYLRKRKKKDKLAHFQSSRPFFRVYSGQHTANIYYPPNFTWVDKTRKILDLIISLFASHQPLPCKRWRSDMWSVYLHLFRVNLLSIMLLFLLPDIFLEENHSSSICHQECKQGFPVFDCLASQGSKGN